MDQEEPVGKTKDWPRRKRGERQRRGRLPSFSRKTISAPLAREWREEDAAKEERRKRRRRAMRRAQKEKKT